MNKKVQMVLTAILAVVFVVAGSMKVIDPVAFFADIQNYDLLPWNSVTVVLAFYLPWLEVICGIALFFRQFRHGALVIILTLLLVFIGALASAWIRGLDISCGCFGSQTEHPRYLLWISRDVLLLLCASGLIFYERYRKA